MLDALAPGYRFTPPHERFGSGAAPALDELALLVNERNGYWRSEPFAVAQASSAWLGSAALAVRFLSRETATRDR